MKYHPASTLVTDVDMESSNAPQSGFPSMTMTSGAAAGPLMAPQDQSSVHHTPDDGLLDDERVAFNSEAFGLGMIPIHAPSINFS